MSHELYPGLHKTSQDQEQMDSILEPRLERAERAYSQALTSLWIGNAGAALATLSFIGATWKTNAFPKVLLWPLGFFILGIVAMGLGALFTLAREKRTIERIQAAESILDLNWSDIESPAERVGLSLRNTRSAMALLAGGCFVVGCVAGFILLVFKAA